MLALLLVVGVVPAEVPGAPPAGTAGTAGSWSSLMDNAAPSPRSGQIAVWTGNEMIVWGGAAGSVENLNDGARYNPVTRT